MEKAINLSISGFIKFHPHYHEFTKLFKSIHTTIASSWAQSSPIPYHYPRIHAQALAQAIVPVPARPTDGNQVFSVFVRSRSVTNPTISPLDFTKRSFDPTNSFIHSFKSNTLLFKKKKREKNEND